MRVVILGNSGSGKSTLARSLARGDVPVLNLDIIYWEPGQIAVKRADGAAARDLEEFCSRNEQWIVEGCYGDLVQHALKWRPEFVFVNPGEATCLSNCRSRPWEPHKYTSKQEQDSKLDFLLRWVSDYYTRDGDMSLLSHRAIFESYDGPKREITTQI